MDTAYSTDVQAAVRRDAFLQDVLKGLRRESKSLPCKWFYDAKGSALYDEITRAPEYYPTRTEVAILQAQADQLAETVGARAALVEFGPGATTKTGISSKWSACQRTASSMRCDLGSPALTRRPILS